MRARFRQGDAVRVIRNIRNDGTSPGEEVGALLVRILTEPRNALVRQYQQLFRYEDVTLEFTEAALTEVARRAMAQGTGARGLRSVLEAVLQRTMYELPSHPDVARCLVDADAVTGAGAVRLEYRRGEEAAEAAC